MVRKVMQVADVSFSVQAKQEMARILPAKTCCRRSEWIGLLRSCGSLNLTGQGAIRYRLVWETEIAAVARAIFRLCRSMDGLIPTLSMEERKRPKKRRFFQVTVPDSPGLRRWLTGTDKLLDGPAFQVGDLLVGALGDTQLRSCCRRAFLRGAFLGFGSVADPGKVHHLEMGPCESPMLAKLQESLQALNIKFGIIERRGQSWLYIKDSESIITFLQVTGANQAVLRYQDAKLMRDVRNHVNRMVNAETANLTKAVEAGLRQWEMIRSLQCDPLWEELPPNVREVAELRLKFPDLSLRELGEMADPPLTKSSVQHCMRQLQKMADRFRA